MPLRFGLVLPIQAKGTELSRFWEELREEVQAADRAGFDAVFLTEFHQARNGALVSPLLCGAGLLQGTERIRFGTAVLAGPLHHPVRLAEDVLMLDHILRGRIVLGVGVGHLAPDFDVFGIPRDRRGRVLDEVLDVLDACFSGEPFHYTGEYFELAGCVTPRPYTNPRPPIWIGAHSARGLERAAHRGDRWISDPERDISTLSRLASEYRARAEAVHRPARVALFREAWIGDSRRECEQIWAPHALAVHRLYYKVGAYLRRYERWVGDLHDRGDFSLDRVAPGRFLYGTPEEVVTTIQEWQASTGADYLCLRLRHPGGPSHEATMETIERFGDEVVRPLGIRSGSGN